MVFLKCGNGSVPSTLQAGIMALNGSKEKVFVMRLLIVEDDLIVADILCMTLEEARRFKTKANKRETALS